MKKIIFAIVLLTVAFASCKKDSYDPQKQAIKDEELIKKYIKDKNIPAVKDTASGLYYYITTPGTGSRPTKLSTVTVDYVGELMENGKRFDQGENVTFSLQGVIEGWQIGLPLVRKGGTITLLVPSALGYRNVATGPIPANSVLVFQVELKDIKS